MSKIMSVKRKWKTNRCLQNASNIVRLIQRNGINVANDDGWKWNLADSARGVHLAVIANIYVILCVSN